MDLRVSSEFNPWVDIWTQPRRTVRALLDTDPGRAVVPLAVLGGVGQVLYRAIGDNLGDQMPAWGIVLLAVVFGPLLGLGSVYLGAVLLRWTGRWIGGTGSAPQIRTALAWANVPGVAGQVLWGMLLLIVGAEIFRSEMPAVEANPLLALLMTTAGLATLLLGVWAVVILLKGLGEVQGFSAWKALVNVLLPTAVIVVPLGILTALIVAIAR